jgi:hypothetical protein
MHINDSVYGLSTQHFTSLAILKETTSLTFIVFEIQFLHNFELSITLDLATLFAASVLRVLHRG